MNRIALFLIPAALSFAQPIPNRYLVELATEPTSAVAASKHQRFSEADRDVQSRRLQLASEHAAAERTINSLHGTVTRHYYHVANAMAVTMSPSAAAQMAHMPGVRSVSPVVRTHILMDQAIAVHRVAQAWQLISGGASSAGAGIRIGILDSGIDASHPAFQNFSTPVPAGFPVTSGTAAQTDVNSKIIVARVYSDLADGVDNTGTDGNDYVQHGTTVAGIAAGLPVDPKFSGVGLISGIAPGAWLGNYKVLSDLGYGSDATFLAGLEDALTDGMNVVNYSAGGPIYYAGDENGIDARAIANALSAGMLVVCAAGNDGPALGSIGTPGASPAAITVGASQNQRWFWFSVTPAGGKSIYAIPPDEELTFVTGDVTGQLVDVATVAGGETHACSALPANSLTGKIALIQRGSPTSASCLFSTKLNNAQAAGAVGAIVYDNTVRSFFDYSLSGFDVSGFEIAASAPPQDALGNDRVVSWSVGTATLPAMLVSKSDGAALLAIAGANVDLDFDGKTSMSYPANQVDDFSSAGPTPLANAKPDIVAVGDWLVAPTSTVYEDASCTAPYALDLVNGCYPAFTFLDSPYLLDFGFGFGYGAYFDDSSGTSFATPMVTGSVALLMSARPGLTGPQYRSLVTNSSSELDLPSTGKVAGPTVAGDGLLDALGAMQQSLTATPTSLSFPTTTAGSSGASSSVVAAAVHADATPAAPSQPVTITNISKMSDTFTVTFNSIDGVATPVADSTSFKLAPGASQTINVSLPTGLAAGQYHGFMLVAGTQGATTLRVPYWYGVAGKTAQNIYVLLNPGTDPSGCNDVIDFRLQDASGLPVTPASDPTVTTTATRAAVTGVSFVGDLPGTYEAAITTGRADANGNNVFTVTADGNAWDIAIGIDNSGATTCSGTGSTAAAVTSRAKSKARQIGLKRPSVSKKTAENQ